jgi:hypothetical protein
MTKFRLLLVFPLKNLLLQACITMHALINLVDEYLNKLPLNKVMLSITFKALFGHYLIGMFQIKGLDMVTRGLG